ncbi:hypothetical protein [Belnapia arida]|nr:hypothetical protein [Belnapia arida]
MVHVKAAGTQGVRSIFLAREAVRTCGLTLSKAAGMLPFASRMD